METLGYMPYIQRGIRFSRVELRDIVIALVVLVIAFAMFQMGGLAGALELPRRNRWFLVQYAFLVAGLAVPLGFLLHELMHKVTAQRYGCWAEFRMFPQGLLLALVTSLIGWLFAAPGAVVISGMVNRKQHRNISAAGPGTNILIGAVCLAIGLIMGPSAAILMSAFSYQHLVWDVAGVNLGLAVFNMIPFGPLDGGKILATDRLLYVGMLAVSLGLLVYFFFVRGAF